MIKSAAIRKDGVVYTGRRHCDIICEQFGKGISFKGLKKSESEGFVTDDGRFVNRQEAANIAFECGQTKENKQTLYSEDIY